jgi:hypothetical protein
MDNAERMAYIRGLNLHTTYAGYSTVVKKNWFCYNIFLEHYNKAL